MTQDGALIGTINKGQFIETAALTGNHVFAGDKPIYVVQYMTGQGSPGTSNLGDPAMGNMIPPEQYFKSYTFSTVGGTQFAQNHLTVIASNTDVTGGTMLLDGVPIPAASFTAVPTTSFSAATMLLTAGTHTTASTAAGHGITVEGYNSFDSYIYPGGAQFEFINPAGDANPPICSAQTNNGPPPFVTGSATDNRPSEDTNNNGVLDLGEDLNNNGQIDKDTGIFFVALEGGSSNVALTVNPFVPGDDTATYRVDLVDPNQPGTGVVRATDGAGNVCRVNVALNQQQQARCDVDKDGDIDKNDLALISRARGQKATGPDDPRDSDGDGLITPNDVKVCIPKCTRPNCAIQ